MAICGCGCCSAPSHSSRCHCAAKLEEKKTNFISILDYHDCASPILVVALFVDICRSRSLNLCIIKSVPEQVVNDFGDG